MHSGALHMLARRHVHVDISEGTVREIVLERGSCVGERGDEEIDPSVLWSEPGIGALSWSALQQPYLLGREACYPGWIAALAGRTNVLHAEPVHSRVGSSFVFEDWHVALGPVSFASREPSSCPAAPHV